MYTAQQLRYLDAMGIPAWIERNHDTSSSIPSKAVTLDPPPMIADSPSVMPAPAASSPLSFVQWLSSECLSAASLDATTSDSQTVYLTGPAQARLLVIADRKIDTSATPFSGPSAKLLQAMLQAISLARSSVLIGATATPPSSSESSSGASVDIATALHSKGATSVRAVLFYTCPDGGHGYTDMDELRDVSHKLHSGVPCVVSYHPIWLLKNAELKRAAWNDLKRVRQLLD